MLVEEIKNRWSILKDEIKKMSEDEKEIEKPDKILKIVKEILDFNKEIQKGGLGLKILKMKLKNEIMQLLYSFYRSKKLVYQSLVDII